MSPDEKSKQIGIIIKNSILIFITVFVLYQCNKNDKPETTISQAPPAVSAAPQTSRPAAEFPPRPAETPYKIIVDRSAGSGINMQILVGPNTTKAQAMALGEMFRSHKPALVTHMYVDICDLEETAHRLHDTRYSESERDAHWLVSVEVNTTTGYSEVQWAKE